MRGSTSPCFRLRLWIAFLVGVFLATARPASAQTATWTGAISFSWNNTGNWSGTAPTDNSSLAFVFGAPLAQNTGVGNVNILSNLTATSITFNGNNDYVLNGQSFTLGGTVSNTGGSNVIGMNVALSATRTFDVTAGNLAISGNLFGTGGVTKTGGNNLGLTANNSYTGATTINGGQLSIPSISNATVAGPLGSSAAAATNLVIDGGTLNFTGASGSTDRGFTAGASGATINVTTAATNLTFSGNSVMTGALNKVGPGTLTLSGANTGAGTTNVNAGTLALGTIGATTGTGLTTVATGATIRGIGTVGGSLTIGNGATVSPGNSVGTLNAGVGTTEWAGGGRYLLEYNHTGGVFTPGTTIDLYNSTGTLNLSAPVDGSNPFVIDLRYLGAPGAALQTPTSNIRIATFAPGGLASFTNSAQFTFAGDFVGALPTLSISGNDLMLSFTPVPEPTTVLGAVAAVLGVGGFVRRRLRGATPA